MADRAAKLHILVVQSWTCDVRPIRDSLEAAGLDVSIMRVDIEPALHAALTWGQYDLVIYDPEATTISRTTVEECLYATRSNLPFIVVGDIASLGDRVRALRHARRS
jgi:DNA-binding NtrC family response regulator